MGQSAKSLLALVVLVTLLAGAFGWAVRGVHDTSDLTPWCRASPLLGVVAVVVLIRADFRRDTLPNLLGQYAKKFYERDGFCFVIVPVLRGQQFSWQVPFQNRYERRCRAVVSFRPSGRSFQFGRPKMDEARVEVVCDGAAFGVAEVPYALPSEYQGRRIQYQIAAAVHYPDGKGKLLRYRDGVRVGAKHKSGLDVGLMAVSGLVGHMHYTSAATFRAELPAIGPSLDAVGNPTQKILWRPTNAPAS